VKLSDALKFSYQRKALHPTSDGTPIIGSDFGIERTTPAGLIQILGLGPCRATDCILESWADMLPDTRRLFMRSESWEPVDPKPAMLILAEASCDWSIHEASSKDEGNA